jgi:hypothetical protein
VARSRIRVQIQTIFFIAHIYKGFGFILHLTNKTLNIGEMPISWGDKSQSLVQSTFDWFICDVASLRARDVLLSLFLTRRAEHGRPPAVSHQFQD